VTCIHRFGWCGAAGDPPAVRLAVVAAASERGAQEGMTCRMGLVGRFKDISRPTATQIDPRDQAVVKVNNTIVPVQSLRRPTSPSLQAKHQAKRLPPTLPSNRARSPMSLRRQSFRAAIPPLTLSLASRPRLDKLSSPSHPSAHFPFPSRRSLRTYSTLYSTRRRPFALDIRRPIVKVRT
jgi:hypothetical protein